MSILSILLGSVMVANIALAFTIIFLERKNASSTWAWLMVLFFIPNGLAENLEKECEAFEQAIKERGPIHLQLLGVGPNGHIGFNEPGTPFDSRTHVATLEEETRQANSRFFNSIDEVPKFALTMGIGTIMEAEEIILLVSGEHKKEILQQIIESDVTETIPATVLKTHPNATLITDLDI